MRRQAVSRAQPAEGKTMQMVRTIRAAALAVCLISLTSLSTLAAGEGPMVDGTVTEVRPGGELTIKHGPIPNLDMSAMTMVFK
ncbi:MAG: copper-binding protein, partial [Alphaproteobacteria bacterium]|nr:copper-binding protein [Alphaproteobacteria bacterium]